MSKKIAMLQIGGYYDYVIIPESIPPQGIFDLMTAQVFKKDYNEPWKHVKDKNVEVLFIDPAELPTPDNQPVIEMRKVLEENNRLTRENERLLEKLAKLETRSADTAVVVAGE